MLSTLVRPVRSPACTHRSSSQSHRTRRSLRVLLLAALASVLVACGGGDSTDGAAEPAERRFISIGTAPAGGAFFVVGGALAEVADLHTDWQVTAEATQGSQENIRRLASGDLDFALSNAAITWFAVRGRAGFEQSYGARSVMTLAPNVALFVTPRSSGVESLADLAGKRVVIGPPGAGFEIFVGPLLEAHGVSLDDIEVLNATQSGAVDLLADGSAAAAFLGGAVPTASVTQAATSMDLVFLPFDEDAKAALIDEYAFFEPATIPAGTYRGLDDDYAGLNVGSMHLISDEQVPEDVVYTMTQAIYENAAEVVARHPAGRAINARRVVVDTGTAFHPGAERFYREIGIWPVDDAAGESADETTETGTESSEATPDDSAETAD
ncbi:MAG: TAXI family TRAP transporter solute-binding subunit [Acidobacteriota bacterium]